MRSQARPWARRIHRLRACGRAGLPRDGVAESTMRPHHNAVMLRKSGASNNPCAGDRNRQCPKAKFNGYRVARSSRATTSMREAVRLKLQAGAAGQREYAEAALQLLAGVHAGRRRGGAGDAGADRGVGTAEPGEIAREEDIEIRGHMAADPKPGTGDEIDVVVRGKGDGQTEIGALDSGRVQEAGTRRY